MKLLFESQRNLSDDNNDDDIVHMECLFLNKICLR